MTPGARIAAAIAILDRILQGEPAEAALLRWARSSRYAGSGDRAAIRDLTFAALRRRNSLAALGGGLTGRGLMIGLARAEGRDIGALFTGEGHAPDAPTPAEVAAPGRNTTPLDDIPDWLHPQWRRSLGDQAYPVAEAMGQRAPVWLRVNMARGNRDAAAAALAAQGIETAPSDLSPASLRVTANERRIAQSDPYRSGLVELQDLSPQLACEALPLGAEDRVLDLCAGGGGKVLALAAREPRARYHAHDIAPQRMSDLPERARRAGARITILPEPRGSFDLVLADVPCSGSGTWRRTPDAKWRLTPQELSRLIALQAKILRQAAGLVRPGGFLAYMTCSLLDDENENQVNALMDDIQVFSRAFQQRWTPIGASDGFFLALMQRDAA